MYSRLGSRGSQDVMYMWVLWTMVSTLGNSVNCSILITDLSGVEYTHPDLKDNYIASLGWSLDGTNNPFPGTTSESHGTSCAGEIGMKKSNGYCGAGVAYNAGITGSTWLL